MQNQIVSPKIDAAFKAIMANEKVRKHFLSDFLGIPVDEIKSVRILNTFLPVRWHREKQGIVDVLLEMHDKTKVNVELQLEHVHSWIERSLYYITKQYSGYLVTGQKYGKLKKCVSIHLLDFNLTKDEAYHHVYRMRREDGREYSDKLEIHVIEMKKRVQETDPIADWVRFMNVSSKEELDTMQTKNKGVMEAIAELKRFSLTRVAREAYEAHLKEQRDRWAREDYVKEQGRQQGLEEGRQQGMQQGLQQGLQQGKLEEQQRLIANMRANNISESQIQAIINQTQSNQSQE